MERFQSAIPLQHALHLLFVVLFRQTANEKFARSVIHLRRYDPHSDGIQDWHLSCWLNFGVFVEFGRASHPQIDPLILNAVQLHSDASLLHRSELVEDKLFFGILTHPNDRVALVENATSLLQNVVQEIFQVLLVHVLLNIAYVNSASIQRTGIDL